MKGQQIASQLIVIFTAIWIFCCRVPNIVGHHRNTFSDSNRAMTKHLLEESYHTSPQCSAKLSNILHTGDIQGGQSCCDIAADGDAVPQLLHAIPSSKVLEKNHM